MTLKEIDARMEVIREAAQNRDFESALSLEYNLYVDVLKAIGDGSCEIPAEACTRALRAFDLKFPRHMS